MCDFSPGFSCSQLLMSKYGIGFGFIEPLLGIDSPLYVPNSMYGICFYQIMMYFGALRKRLWAVKTLLVLSVLACLMNVYLIYILYLLQVICIVSISTYAVNIALLFVNVKEYSSYVPEKPAALFQKQRKKIEYIPEKPVPQEKPVPPEKTASKFQKQRRKNKKR